MRRCAWGSGFGIWVLGFLVWGLVFGVWGLGFEVGVWGLELRVLNLGFGVWGLGSRVSCAPVLGLGFEMRALVEQKLHDGSVPEQHGVVERPPRNLQGGSVPARLFHPALPGSGEKQQASVVDHASVVLQAVEKATPPGRCGGGSSQVFNLLAGLVASRVGV